MAELAAQRLQIQQPEFVRDQPSNGYRFTIPAQARRYKANKLAFDSDEQAYAAGQFYMAKLFKVPSAQKFCREHGLITASQSGGDNRRGGVFVPLEVETSIIRLVEQYGVFRQNSMVEPMASDRKVKPVRISGLTAYPAAESNTANQSSNTTTETDVDYNNVELVARKWKAVCRVSDELNEDAVISMANEISLEMALAFAYAEDNAGFNGDGTSSFHGIVGLKNALAAGSIYDCIAGNTGFTTLDLEDFEYALAKLPNFPNMQPAWYISKPGYYASMARLQMAAGGNTVANIAGAPQLNFMGLPVVWVNVLPTTLGAQASTIVAYVGDLRMSTLFGDRRGMTMSLDGSRYWDVDQVGIKGTERFDINVHSKGTATAAGAIIAIKTAS